MKQIEVFWISSSWYIEPHQLQQLQPHFETITEINLNGKSTAASAIAQEILSSCPMLTRFGTSYMEGTHIAEGQPWVCLGLKELDAGLKFEPLTIHHVQPLVFDQLSRLTRIEDLTLDSELYRDAAFQTTSDLRLEYGLHKLATLRSLEMFIFHRTTQRMGYFEMN
ncbi:hypothetical protein BGZ65_007845 [Modicella reniformis]|uniref:Uncharacterized protein n=1 Tax=Modicella reniformis TaxID=1440133 RepID=A0A9P6LTN1_9FUNG|nr:hypothetical protein BGZ65_007845 [Modicella reniformis]